MIHPVYERLLSEITEETERKVFQVLLDHVGEHVTRPQMVLEVFGVYVQQKELAGSKEDRKIRVCVEALQRKEFPISASSGEAGYILAADEHSVDAYIAELVSRQTNLEHKVGAVRRSKRWIPLLMEWKSSRPAVQARLL